MCVRVCEREQERVSSFGNEVGEKGMEGWVYVCVRACVRARVSEREGVCVCVCVCV